MAIASCFFCVPTPNTSISESNLTWPHLASFPNLSSSSFTISTISISLNRRISISPIFSASTENRGSNNTGGGGGSGDKGKSNGDGDGGKDMEMNRNEAMILLTEYGTRLETLPKDPAAAIESDGISRSVITRISSFRDRL